jgi:hypothetical protein
VEKQPARAERNAGQAINAINKVARAEKAEGHPTGQPICLEIGPLHPYMVAIDTLAERLGRFARY